MNEIFEKTYNDNNTDLNESSALFEKVYTEAEMLNEMNPKLRALLAAGLIGTVSLGAASCSMPTDDPTGYEQPAPETTNPDDPGDNNGGEETVTEEQKQLNALLKIIDDNLLREDMKGVRYYPKKFEVLLGNDNINSFVISPTGIIIPNIDNGLLGKSAYCFGKQAEQEGHVNLYWVLKADFPDLDPDAFLAAL